MQAGAPSLCLHLLPTAAVPPGWERPHPTPLGANKAHQIPARRGKATSIVRVRLSSHSLASAGARCPHRQLGTSGQSREVFRVVGVGSHVVGLREKGGLRSVALAVPGPWWLPQMTGASPGSEGTSSRSSCPRGPCLHTALLLHPAQRCSWHTVHAEQGVGARGHLHVGTWGPHHPHPR